MDTSKFRFAHHKLHVYETAVCMAEAVKRLLPKVPRGYGKWTEQLRRSAGSPIDNSTHTARVVQPNR